MVWQPSLAPQSLQILGVFAVEVPCCLQAGLDAGSYNLGNREDQSAGFLGGKAKVPATVRFKVPKAPFQDQGRMLLVGAASNDECLQHGISSVLFELG